MRFLPATLFVALLTSSLAFATEKESVREYYRYRDAKGVMRISQGIPPEFSKMGYDVITADGTLIKKVPRELTAEELKATDSVEMKKRAAEAAAKQQLKDDQALLRRYSTAADIESARNRAINDIKIRIGIINSNLLSLKQQIEREQNRAANLERSGQPVPQELTDNIKALNAEVDETERTIEQRQLEIKQEEKNYQADMDRLKFLLDRIHGKRPN